METSPGEIPPGTVAVRVNPPSGSTFTPSATTIPANETCTEEQPAEGQNPWPPILTVVPTAPEVGDTWSVGSVCAHAALTPRPPRKPAAKPRARALPAMRLAGRAYRVVAT
jgi:hypothetical protein